MKKKLICTFRIIIICLGSCLIFVATGYFYLVKKIEKAENHTSEVPYTLAVPENAGIIVDICGSKTFFQLNFEDKELLVIFPDENFDYSSGSLYGYSVDYRITSDYSLVADIIDFVDGIEIIQNGETLRFTGVQVTDLLSRTQENSQLKRNILKQICENIAKKGFEKKNYIYIIENSETNLTVPDCYFWPDYMCDLCKNAKFVN